MIRTQTSHLDVKILKVFCVVGFFTFVKSATPAGHCWAEDLATPGVQGKCAVRVMYIHLTGDQVTMYIHLTGDQVLYIHPGDQLTVYIHVTGDQVLYIHVTGDQLTMYVHTCYTSLPPLVHTGDHPRCQFHQHQCTTLRYKNQHKI